MAKKHINMDVDPDLWRQAKRAAVEQDLSLREWVADAIQEKLERDEQARTDSEAAIRS